MKVNEFKGDSDQLQKNKGNCELLPVPFGVYIKKDNRNYVEPDISVICNGDKLDEKGCHGASDWVIEIVSSKQKDGLCAKVSAL